MFCSGVLCHMVEYCALYRYAGVRWVRYGEVGYCAGMPGYGGVWWVKYDVVCRGMVG